MAKNRWYNFTGKARFFKIYSPEFFEGVGRYKAPIVIDAETMAEIKAIGIRRQFKDDPDSKDKIVTFSRDFEKDFKEGKVYFCPPSVYDKDGKALVEYYNKETNTRVTQFNEEDKDKIEKRGVDVLVGNNSLVTLSVSTYEAGKFKGSRLESIKILDLVEYVKFARVSELADADGVPFEVTQIADVPDRQDDNKVDW